MIALLESFTISALTCSLAIPAVQSRDGSGLENIQEREGTPPERPETARHTKRRIVAGFLTCCPVCGDGDGA